MTDAMCTHVHWLNKAGMRSTDSCVRIVTGNFGGRWDHHSFSTLMLHTWSHDSYLAPGSCRMCLATERRVTTHIPPIYLGKESSRIELFHEVRAKPCPSLMQAVSSSACCPVFSDEQETLCSSRMHRNVVTHKSHFLDLPGRAC